MGKGLYAPLYMSPSCGGIHKEDTMSIIRSLYDNRLWLMPLVGMGAVYSALQLLATGAGY